MVNLKLSAVCVIFAVAPALIALATKQLAPAVEWTPTVPLVHLSDGRRLAYEIRGNPSSKHTAIYIHGTPSCRLEFLGLDHNVLNSVGLRLVGVDKPGYGQSDPHYGRSLRSFVTDLEELADHLKLQRFLLIGVSGGGPYSWATARYAPHRVQGLLILSGAGNLGMLLTQCSTAEDFALFTRMLKQLHAVQHYRRLRHLAAGILDAKERAQFDVQVSGVHRRIAHFFHSTYSTPIKSLLKYLFETKIGGRQLYSTVLQPLMRDPMRFMADPDKECLQQGHKEYMTKVIPEALRQGSATPWVQDLGLFSGDWGFNVSDIEPHVKSTIHLWHGTGDRQVSEVMSVAFKRLVPQATLRIIDGGAHFQYFVCNLDLQKEALIALLRTSI